MKINVKVFKRFITGFLEFSDKSQVIIHRTFKENIENENVEELIEDEIAPYLKINNFQQFEFDKYFSGNMTEPDENGTFQDSDGDWNSENINAYDEIWA